MVVVGGMASTAERYSEREDFGVVSSTCRTSIKKISNMGLERRVPFNFPIFPGKKPCDWKASGVEAWVKEEGAGARPLEI